YLKIIVVFILMLNTLTTAKRIDQLTWLILVCCGYISGRAVLDYARGINVIEQGRVTAAIGGIFGNPNDLALNMVTFLPAAAVITMGKHHSPFKRLMAAGIAATMLTAIVFTKSRGGAIGLLVTIAALV